MSILKYKFKDIENSLSKFIKLINIIEDNIYNPYEYIEIEIIINLNITIDAVRRLFNKFYPLDISFYEYISERQRSIVIKEIENINDNASIEKIIRKITNTNMKYFNDELYKDYGVRISDIKKDKNIKLNFLEAFDTSKLEQDILDISNSLDYLSSTGYIDLKRTKIKINNININKLKLC